MESERRMNRQKASDLATLFKARDHLIEINVSQAIAIVRKKDLLVLNLFPDRPEPFTDIAPDTGINQRDAPIVLGLAQEFDSGATCRDDAIGIGLRFVAQKEILNDGGL